MKEQFSGHEKKMIERLINTGMDEKMASMLVFVNGRDGCTRRDIEDALDLRQPEVSMGMQDLRDRGWVGKDKKKTEGKGRPFHIYSMDSSLDTVIEEVTSEEKEKIEEIEENIDKLNELADVLA